MSFAKITQLDGRYLTSLVKLDANGSELHTFNSENMSKLEDLDLWKTPISHLNTRHLKKLEKLNILSTSIRMVDLHNCKKLKRVCFEETEFIIVREGVREIHSEMEILLDMLRDR